MIKAKKTKKCTSCKQVRPISEFHNKASTSDGLDYSCKKCKCNYMKNYKKKKNVSKKISKKNVGKKTAKQNKENNLREVSDVFLDCIPDIHEAVENIKEFDSELKPGLILPIEFKRTKPQTKSDIFYTWLGIFIILISIIETMSMIQGTGRAFHNEDCKITTRAGYIFFPSSLTCKATKSISKWLTEDLDKEVQSEK